VQEWHIVHSQISLSVDGSSVPRADLSIVSLVLMPPCLPLGHTAVH